MPEGKLLVSEELLADAIRMLPPGYKFMGAQRQPPASFLVTMESDRLRGDEGLMVLSVEVFPGGYTVRLQPVKSLPSGAGELRVPE